MSVNTTKLTLVRGDSYTFPFTVKDENALPIDLTGSTIYFTIKKNRDDTDAVAELQVIQATHLDALNGISTIPVAKTDWQDDTAGTYWYDVQIAFASGDVKTVLMGQAVVLKDVTKTY